MALVIGDHPEREFQTHEWTTDWTYIRLNHGKAGVDAAVFDGELTAWAERIGAWRDRGDIYAYFNSDEEVFAVQDAEVLEQLLTWSIGHSSSERLRTRLPQRRRSRPAPQ